MYKQMLSCDVYDMERDARTYDGPHPIVAHPPCRAWGRLRQFAKPRPDERNLGRLAVSLVREFGGVLEHPACSTLFDACAMPRPGEFPDQWSGYTIEIAQYHFGHKAEKLTWLYIVGCVPSALPVLSHRDGRPTHCVRPTKNHPRLPSITKSEREHTPPALAAWLVETARRCQKDNG